MKSKGFTLLESLIALSVISIALLILITSLHALNHTSNERFESKDEASIIQIRLILALSKDIKFKDSEIIFNYQDNDLTLKQYQDKIIITPGYQVFFDEIDKLSFKDENNCKYIVYERKNISKDRVIYCE